MLHAIPAIQPKGTLRLAVATATVATVTVAVVTVSLTPSTGAGRGGTFYGSERVTEGRSLSTSFVSYLSSCCHSELNAVHCHHRNRGVLVGLINFELRNFVSLSLPFFPPLSLFLSLPLSLFLPLSLSLPPSPQDGRFNPFTLNPGQSHELYYLDTAKPPKLVVTVSYFSQIGPPPDYTHLIKFVAKIINIC